MGGECFFKYVFYEVGEGNRIWFWYDRWSGHFPLKDLYLFCLRAMFPRKHCFVICYILLQLGGIGARIYNSIELFKIVKLEDVLSFFELLYSKLLRGEGDDRLI